MLYVCVRVRECVCTCARVCACVRVCHLFRFHILPQVCATKPSVPVIRNVSAIHDLTKQVTQVCPGNLGMRTSGNSFIVE